MIRRGVGGIKRPAWPAGLCIALNERSACQLSLALMETDRGIVGRVQGCTAQLEARGMLFLKVEFGTF